ncbi:MAG: peptidoglycan DD-metalloendopeptidase family protein [Porcipelethomonas sp.]
MKKNSKSVLGGKGFYIALALSVAMVGAACYFAYTETSDEFTGQLESSSIASEDVKENRDAANVQTDVPKITTVTRLTQPEKQTQPAAVTAAVSEETESAEDSEAAAQQTAMQQMEFSMPVQGEIFNEFSGGELVKSNTTGAWQTHNGIDIKAASGDAVSAAASGTVSAVENDPLWGVTVTIDHGNGIISRYCNLNSGVTVQAGQEVSGGEEIGAVGTTADIETSEESHLHFEVLKNGSYTDPAELMQ